MITIDRTQATFSVSATSDDAPSLYRALADVHNLPLSGVLSSYFKARADVRAARHRLIGAVKNRDIGWVDFPDSNSVALNLHRPGDEPTSTPRGSVTVCGNIEDGITSVHVEIGATDLVDVLEAGEVDLQASEFFVGYGPGRTESDYPSVEYLVRSSGEDVALDFVGNAHDALDRISDDASFDLADLIERAERAAWLEVA